MSKENATTDNDQQTDNILKELRERGLELELQAYLQFQKRGWFSKIHGTYWDLQIPKEESSWLESIRKEWEGQREPVYRTIDLLASKSEKLGLEKHPQIQIRGVIECKWRKGENWVFYCETIENEASAKLLRDLLTEFTKLGMPDPDDALEVMSIHETSLFTSLDRKTYKDLLMGEMAKQIQGASHHSRKNLKSAALLHMSVFGSSKQDSIRNACEQILDALEFQERIWSYMSKSSMEQHGGFNIWRIYPIVIFNGPIWKLTLNPDGSLIPTRAGFITYNYQRGKSNYLIDFVSFPFLNTYIDLLESELTTMKERACIE